MSFIIYHDPTPGVWAEHTTITDVVSASQAYRANEISQGQLTIPATSNAQYALVPDRLIVGRDGDEEICSFLIHSIKTRITQSGTYIDISGPDQLHELTRYNIGTDVLDDGNGNPATDDLAQVIAYMPSFLNWRILDPTNLSIARTGTKTGTAFAASGETIFDMLRVCAEQSGEVFRLQQDADPTDRIIGWFQNPPPLGNTQLSIPSNPLAVEDNAWVGFVFSADRELDYTNLITSASVFGSGMGAQRTTITAAEGHVSIPPGWSVDWANSIITTSKEAVYRTQLRRTKTFSSIRPKDETDDALRVAAISLFNTAVTWLEEVSEPLDIWRLTTRTKQNNRPGDYIYINPIYINGQFDFYGGNYYIQDVKHEYKYQKRVTTLSLSLRPAAFRQPQDSSLIVQKLKEVDQTIRHTSAASSTYSSGTTPSITYHDSLFGRTDPQNHTQYLLKDGSRPIEGNQLMADGVKIDGMDPSAHLVQPNAHHNWPLLESDIPAEIARVSDAHNPVTLAIGSDPILTLNAQQELHLGDVATQAEFNAKVNQDLRTNASPTFVDLSLVGGLVLTDRITSKSFRLFVSNEKVYLEEIS